MFLTFNIMSVCFQVSTFVASATYRSKAYLVTVNEFCEYHMKILHIYSKHSC